MGRRDALHLGLDALLGAAAQGRVDAETVDALRDVLRSLAPLLVELGPGTLVVGGAVVASDPVTPPGAQGLVARLEAWGVKSFEITRDLEASSVEALLAWSASASVGPPPEGIGLVLAPAAERSVSELTARLGKDPESGIDLIGLCDGPTGSGPPLPTTDPADRVAETLRQKLGPARLATAEAELRQSLSDEALKVALRFYLPERAP